MYSNEQLEYFKNILNKYNIKEDCKPTSYHHSNCSSRGVSGGCDPPVFLGQYICDSCGVFKGYVLGYYDIKEKDRFFYKKKSIYERKYHYEKKVNQISKRIKLNDDEKCQLFSKLMDIDDNVIKIINKNFSRKRMINIFYLIKNILKEMGCEKSELVYLKISPQTLDYYDKWWRSYKNILLKQYVDNKV